MQTEEVSTSGMMAEVGAVNSAAKHKATTGEETELPVGGKVADEVETKVEASAEVEAPPVVEEKTEIRIGDQVFTSQSDAIKYAETLAQEKMINDAYTMGARDSARVNAPDVSAPVVEDNFEEKFYSDPKGTLKTIKETAVQEALQTIKAEQNRENLWKKFFNENPDLEGHRAICEHTLQQNWNILGQMTDLDKAMKILATKTRSIFQTYNDAAKPRTELQRKSANAVSTGVGVTQSVTPKNKEERVLTMAEQMRTLNRR